MKDMLDKIIQIEKKYIELGERIQRNLYLPWKGPFPWMRSFCR